MIRLVGLRLDHRGISNILRSREVRDSLKPYAERIAAHARQNVDADMPVEIDTYTTDRAAYAVTIAHPAGIAMEARHGVLTRAAAASGLEVKDT